MSVSSDLKGELERKTGEVRQYIDLDKLPERVEAKLLAYVFRKDKKGNDSLFITLETKDGKLIVQKYTKSTWMPIYEQFSKIGFERLESEYRVWRLRNVGRAINPRLMPVSDKGE